MRKQLFKGLATFGVFLTLTMGSVQAQTGYEIEANIPFDFTAGKASLPSGIYCVKVISDNTLLVRSIDGKKAVMLFALATEPLQTEKPERIIFNRYGDRYFLSQAWMSRGHLGRELYPSRAERRLAKEHRLSKGDAKSQQVAVRRDLK